MTKEQIDAIREVLENSYTEYDIRDSYSGRGMMGSTTYAVVLDDENELLSAIGDFLEGACEDDIETVNALGSTLARGFRRDSMGMGVVLY